MKKILFAIGEGPTSEKVASDGFEIAKQLSAEIAIAKRYRHLHFSDRRRHHSP